MNLTRVLVAHQSRLMREVILLAICEQQDLEIVGEIQHDSEIEGAVERTRPDFLIIDQKVNDPLPENCRRLLGKYPSMKIIAVPQGSSATVYYWAALEFHSNKIETSEKSLLNVLHGKDPSSGE